jgi:hypothetical protein
VEFRKKVTEWITPHPSFVLPLSKPLLVSHIVKKILLDQSEGK